MGSATAATLLGPVLVLRDRRIDTRALSSGQYLAGVTGADLTVLETGTRQRGRSGGILHLPVSEDRVGADVAAQADDRRASVVVLDALAGGPAAGPLFDTTAEQVLARSRRPVLVFGPHAVGLSRPPTFVIGVDGGATRDALVRPVRELAMSINRSEVVVAGLVAPDPWPADGLEPVVDPARELAATLAATVSVSLIRVECGDAATALIDIVEPLTSPVLVVASPRWADASSHWYATARRLIRHAPCPVLVIPNDVR